MTKYELILEIIKIFFGDFIPEHKRDEVLRMIYLLDKILEYKEENNEKK